MPLFFKNDSFAELILPWIKLNKTKSFWGKKKTDRKSVNYLKLRNVTLQKVRMKISDTPFFKTISPILPTPPCLGKI